MQPRTVERPEPVLAKKLEIEPAKRAKRPMIAFPNGLGGPLR
jgi:hypothetical protein